MHWYSLPVRDAWQFVTGIHLVITYQKDYSINKSSPFSFFKSMSNLESMNYMNLNDGLQVHSKMDFSSYFLMVGTTLSEKQHTVCSG